MLPSSKLSLAAALLLASQVMAMPGWASSRNAGSFTTARRDAGESHRGEGGSSRGHRGREGRHKQAGLELLILPALALAGPTVPGRNSSRDTHVVLQGPFVPPTRFSYYCNQPSDYYPTVIVCAVPWVSTGGEPSP